MFRSKGFLCLMLMSVFIAVFAVPVFAQEVTNPNEVIKEETFNASEDILANEFHNSQIWRSNNYLKYLDGVIYNLEEVARIKKEVVDNYKYLSSYNSEFANLIPKAQADYDQALAWVEYYKQYKILVKQNFDIKYL